MAFVVLWCGVLQAQVPIPIDEQVRLFNSLPPAQQQALIRELQRELPPAQRQAIIAMLQGDAGLPQGEDLDSETASILEGALSASAADEDEEADAERFRPGDSVVLEFSIREQQGPIARTLEEQQRLADMLERLARGNPYELDRSGQLLLPGVRAIALAGLNADQATIRIQNEPSLRDFTVIVTRLPLRPVGTAALKLFGRNLFERSRSRFGRVDESGPVPVNYVIGPGDTVTVQLFGNENAEYFLTVNRDGTINFPSLGPIPVSGLNFDELRTLISERVATEMIGVRASVSLGELRSIQVFVVGDVVRPGAVRVGSMATITTALFASGGIEPIGSLRNITLLRNGQRVAQLDLYDVLLRGDTTGDVRLQPGDTVLVPPIGPTVTVDGEVRRPAIYELRTERTVAELLQLAGGVNAAADRTAVNLERIVPNRGRTAVTIDLARAGGSTPVRDGDVIRVPSNLEVLQDSVRLEGNVQQPGLYNWSPGMRLTDLIPSSERLKPLSDLNYVFIRREVAPNVTVEVISADLKEAWRDPSGPQNVRLEPRDTVHVFNLDSGRAHVIAPVIEELTAMAGTNAPIPVVRVAGQVRAEGEYPLEPGMRVSDLLRAGGGLRDAAYAGEAELTRYAVINGEYRETELIPVNLAAVLAGDESADVELAPYDYLSVKEVSRWRAGESVTIRGEVAFPGTYPIRRGETLSSVLARAGGLTDLAFPQGSVFTRVELREREREQLEVLARRIERDLAAISVSEPNASQTITTGQSLISQLRNSVATGRLVIQLDALLAGDPSADVVLKDGDQLIVPSFRQEVTVLGEVQYATSHVYERSLSRDDYIARSGGLTQRADNKRIYVVRANGEVVVDRGVRWFSRDRTGRIQPGDTIVVPLDVDQPVARWTGITQIIYNLAIAAAAVSSF